LFGSGESRPKCCSSDQIDGTDDVVGQHAERCFPADFLEASGEVAPAGGHSLDGSERMFRGASALSDQSRIGLEAGVHSFQGILMEVPADKATLCVRAARLE